MCKVNNKNTICSKLTTETPGGRRHRSDVFIVNFEQISHVAFVE